MKIRNQNVDPNSQIGRHFLVIPIISAINLTGAVIFSYLPGYKFKVTRIRTFCRAKAGTVTADVKLGTRVTCAATFTAATEVAGTLSTTAANNRATTTEALTVELTTDGTGALTNGFIVVELRPVPMAGEIGPVARA